MGYAGAIVWTSPWITNLSLHAFFLCACPVHGYFVNSNLAGGQPITLAGSNNHRNSRKYTLEFHFPTLRWMKIKTHYFVEKHSNMLQQAIARAPTLAHGYDLLMNLAHNNANKSSTEMTKSVVCVDMAGEVPLAGL